MRRERFLLEVGDDCAGRTSPPSRTVSALNSRSYYAQRRCMRSLARKSVSRPLVAGPPFAAARSVHQAYNQTRQRLVLKSNDTLRTCERAR